MHETGKTFIATAREFEADETGKTFLASFKTIAKSSRKVKG